MKNNIKPNVVMEIPAGVDCKPGDKVRVRLDDGTCAEAVYIGPSSGWSSAYKLHVARIGSPIATWVGPGKPTKTKLRFVYPVEKNGVVSC